MGEGVVMRNPDDRPATWSMNSLFERLASGEETGGAYGLSLVTQPPGTAPPMHVHTREAEAFLVLSGTMTYRAGEETYELGEGSFLHLPCGVPHGFRVTGVEPVRFVALTVPGALMHLYDEVGVPARERRLPDGDGRPFEDEVARWNEAGPRYGLRVVGPPLPES